VWVTFGATPPRRAQQTVLQRAHGILPERIVLSTPLDPYLPLRALAQYAGLSVRTLRNYLDGAPDEALPCYRVGGKILVRRSEFDAWITRHRAHGRPSLARAMRAMGLVDGT
jgi:hypothetical protein